MGLVGVASTSYLRLAGQMVLLGSGIGLTSAPANEAIMGVVPKEKAGIGSAVNDATRVFGATLGVAVIGSVYASLYASRLSARLPSSLPAALAHAAHDSVGAALTVSGGLAHAQLSALAAGVHDAASSAFFNGFGAGVLVAAAVGVAGAALAGVLVPAYPPTPAGEKDHRTGEPAAEPAAEPMPISILLCIAGCQSANAAVRGHELSSGRTDD